MGVSKKEFRFGRNLSAEEAARYLAATKRLWGHRRDRDLLEMLQRNVDDYEECRRGLEQVVPTPGSRTAEQRESEIEINRRFLAVLAAFRQYVDRIETRLKREYGKSSAIVKAFKNETANLFDTHFEYRFAVKLRNYAQHTGTPVGAVEHQTTTDPFTGGELHRLHLTHDPQTLLENADDTWGPVRHDLAKMEGPFSVAQLPTALLVYARRLWVFLEVNEADALAAAAKTCVDIVAEVRNEDAPAVIRMWSRDNGTQTIEFIQPPIDLMEHLEQPRFREIL